MRFVVTVGFTIRGNMRELRPRTQVGVGAEQAVCECFTVVENIFECDGSGCRIIVKEKR